MNGNRGAKGSIKDRLISLLYRLRYKKNKKLEDYTIPNKEKQLNYINNLNEFKETENVNILDNKDKNILDSVKINVKINVNNVQKKIIPKQIILIKPSIKSNNKPNNMVRIKNTTKKVGYVENKIEKHPLKDTNLKIEEPTLLNKSVNIKKEARKTKDEISIIKEINTFIKKSIENLDQINTEVNEIKLELKEPKETKKIEERYNKLKEKIEKLKEQYDTIKDKYDLSEFAILGGIKLIDNIDDYSSIANLNEIELMVRVCKKEIEKIESITIINDKSKKLSTDIKDKEQQESNIKIKFNKHKEKVKNVNDIEDKISKELSDQEQIVNDMYKEATYFEEKISKEIEYVGHRKMLSSMLNIISGILTLPLSGMHLFGIALGSTMINKGLKELNKKLETREKIVISYDYKDISEKISKVKDKIEYTNLILTDSLNEIKKLKNNFNNIFKDYEYILPDYYDTLNKIESLESNLINQQYKLNKIDKKLEEEKELNNSKLMKIKN